MDAMQCMVIPPTAIAVCPTKIIASWGAFSGRPVLTCCEGQRQSVVATTLCAVAELSLVTTPMFEARTVL